jgi:hypothetical protein
MELVNQRADADWLRSKYAASQRRVCGLMGMAVASYCYRSQRTDERLRTRLVELARSKPRFGYRRLHVLLGRSGEHVNHKRHRSMFICCSANRSAMRPAIELPHSSQKTA